MGEIGTEDNHGVVAGLPVTVPATASSTGSLVLTPAAVETLRLLRSGADHPLVQSFAAGAMLIFDRDLRYLCAGGLALADVGLSTAMMEGKTIFEVFEPDFIAVIEPQYRLALSGVESVMDLHYAGNVYSQRLAPVRDPDGEIVAGMGYTQDVTEARRSESALRESDEHSRRAFEDLADERRRMRDAEAIGRLGSWELDLATDDLVLSDNLCRLYGIAPHAFTGEFELIMQCIHADDREWVRDIMTTAAHDGQAFSMQYRVIRVEDGALRWFSARGEGLYENGELQRLGGAVSDVTESVLAAAEATAAHAMQQAVISTSPDIIFVYDVPTRSVIWTNRSLAGLLGYDIPDAHASGVDPLDIMIPESDRGPFGEALAQAIDAVDGEVISLDHRMRHADGSIRWFSRRTTVLNRGDLGAVSQLVGVARDITDRRQAEGALLAAEAADRANAAKNDFLSRMSHELRTPLNAVLGFAQLLELDPLTGEQQSGVQQILRGGRHLLGLINDVLEISKIESDNLDLSLELVPVVALLSETVQLMMPQALSAGVTLRFEPAAAARYRVHADQRRLRQVLINLLSNAIKYNRRGGRVVVRCRTNVGGFGPYEGLEIDVTDTGPGIRKLDLPRLFTPFERLGAESTAIEGSGVGLALSQRLMTSMGGSLTATSEFGVGSTFTLSVPLSGQSWEESTAKVAAPAVHAPLERGPSARTLLYIEDNSSNVELMKQVISRRPGWQMMIAGDGALGIELARTVDVELVLLDLHLPDTNGIDVLRTLRADPATRQLEIVVVSADANAHQQDRLRDAGADAYLTKPIDVARVLALLDQLPSASEA